MTEVFQARAKVAAPIPEWDEYVEELETWEDDASAARAKLEELAAPDRRGDRGMLRPRSLQRDAHVHVRSHQLRQGPLRAEQGVLGGQDPRRPRGALAGAQSLSNNEKFVLVETMKIATSALEGPAGLVGAVPGLILDTAQWFLQAGFASTARSGRVRIKREFLGESFTTRASRSSTTRSSLDGKFMLLYPEGPPGRSAGEAEGIPRGQRHFDVRDNPKPIARLVPGTVLFHRMTSPPGSGYWDELGQASRGMLPHSFRIPVSGIMAGDSILLTWARPTTTSAPTVKGVSTWVIMPLGGLVPQVINADFPLQKAQPIIERVVRRHPVLSISRGNDAMTAEGLFAAGHDQRHQDGPRAHDPDHQGMQSRLPPAPVHAGRILTGGGNATRVAGEARCSRSSWRFSRPEGSARRPSRSPSRRDSSSRGRSPFRASPTTRRCSRSCPPTRRPRRSVGPGTAASSGSGRSGSARSPSGSASGPARRTSTPTRASRNEYRGTTPAMISVAILNEIKTTGKADVVWLLPQLSARPFRGVAGARRVRDRALLGAHGRRAHDAAGYPRPREAARGVRVRDEYPAPRRPRDSVGAGVRRRRRRAWSACPYRLPAPGPHRERGAGGARRPTSWRSGAGRRSTTSSSPPGSDALDDTSAPALQALADALGKHPDWAVTILGHTDSIGGEDATRTSPPGEPSACGACWWSGTGSPPID